MKTRIFALARARGRELAGGALLVLLSAARLMANGFAYYPQLDDYIQYYKYTALDTPAGAVAKYGMLAARPLSNTADVFVWAKFWGHMFAAVMILSLLYAAAVIILGRVFHRLFPQVFGVNGEFVFALFCLLLPLNIEGTYWLSASTRVVCGLFWCALAAELFLRWLDSGNPVNAALYGLFQLFAMASYEQSLMLTAALTAVIMIREWKKSRVCVLVGLLTVSNALFYWAFTSLFQPSSALYGNAYGVVSPFRAYFWTNQLPHVIKQFTAAFIGGGVMTLIKGATRGISLIFTDGKIAFGALAAVCAAAVFAYVRKCATDGERQDTTANLTADAVPYKGSTLPFIAGLVLAAAPLAPFVIKENPWFSLRGTVCSLPGIALCVGSLASATTPRFAKLADRIKFIKSLPAALCALFTLMSFCAAASELNDYKLTYIHDTAVMTALAEAIDMREIKGRIALSGVEPSYLADQNFRYHEHIHGVTESEWALSGALYTYNGGMLDPSVRFVPLRSDAAERAFADENSGGTNKYDVIYIYTDGKFVRADINPAS